MKNGFKKGDFKFVLKGKKLKGEFVLVKIKNRFGDKDNTGSSSGIKISLQQTKFMTAKKKH
ncbi:MAG: hypothetical protein WKF88_03050 [Ferruginibacter sp.]